MNLLKLTFGLCLSVILTTSCSKDNMCTTAQGAKTEQLRNTPSFDEINLRIPGDVVLSYGKDFEVTVNAASNLQSIIETNVSGNTLIIEEKDGECINGTGNIEVFVTLPYLAKVSIEGSGDVRNTEAIPTGNLTLEISGSGDINLNDLSPTEYTTRISGSGDINLAGTGSANFGIITVDGSGDIDVSDIEAKTVDVEIKGSGDSRVHAVDQLKVKIEGSGNVYYKGNPSMDVNISGSGEVKKL